MKLRNNTEAAASLDILQQCGLLTGHEIEVVNRLGNPESPLDNAVELAETAHLHIKVDDTHKLPINQFFDAGARLDHQKDGFGEIRRANPKLAESFFAYYGQVMADGELTRREKALIALAVSHALKCPYCIDSYTSTLYKMHVSEAEMSEAVHVASAMAAGIALVHSVQMMNKLDQLEAHQDNGASLGAGAGD